MPTRSLSPEEAKYVNEWQTYLRTSLDFHKEDLNGLKDALFLKDGTLQMNLQGYLTWLKSLPEEFPELVNLSNSLENHLNLLITNPKEETINYLLKRDFQEIEKIAKSKATENQSLQQSGARNNVYVNSTPTETKAREPIKKIKGGKQAISVHDTKLEKQNANLGKKGEAIIRNISTIAIPKKIDPSVIPEPNMEIGKSSISFHEANPNQGKEREAKISGELFTKAKSKKIDPNIIPEAPKIENEQLQIFDRTFNELYTSEVSYNQSLKDFLTLEDEYNRTIGRDFSKIIFDNVRKNLTASNEYLIDLSKTRDHYERSLEPPGNKVYAALSSLNNINKKHFGKMSQGYLESAETKIKADRMTKQITFKKENPVKDAIISAIVGDNPKKLSWFSKYIIKSMIGDKYFSPDNPDVDKGVELFLEDKALAQIIPEKGRNHFLPSDPLSQAISDITILSVQRGPRQALLTKEIIKQTNKLMTAEELSRENNILDANNANAKFKDQLEEFKGKLENLEEEAAVLRESGQNMEGQFEEFQVQTQAQAQTNPAPILSEAAIQQTQDTEFAIGAPKIDSPIRKASESDPFANRNSAENEEESIERKDIGEMLKRPSTSNPRSSPKGRKPSV